MARRRGRPGAYLMSDDYTGFIVYDSELKRDYWGAYSKRPLIRNLQEIASPIDDPIPVNVYRGPNYEYVDPATTTVAPTYIGDTNIRTSHDNPAFQSGAVT